MNKNRHVLGFKFTTNRDICEGGKRMRQRCGTCGNGRVNKSCFKEKGSSLSYAVRCSLDSKNKHKDSVCSNWKEKK